MHESKYKAATSAKQSIRDQKCYDRSCYFDQELSDQMTTNFHLQNTSWDFQLRTHNIEPGIAGLTDSPFEWKLFVRLNRDIGRPRHSRVCLIQMNCLHTRALF